MIWEPSVDCTQWRQVFAWLPVTLVDGRKAWLVRVWRKKSRPWANYIYSLEDW